MAITVQDRNGTYGRKRKAEGPPLDKRSARYFAVVNNVWSKGATTRRAAELVERKMKADAERGVSLTGSALTLQQFFDTVWWPSVDSRQKRGDIAIGTALHYKIVADSYILPTLGAKRLRHLSPAHLRALYAELRAREKPLSPRTIQATHRVVSMMLVFALDDGYIVSNPARGRDVAPKTRSTRRRSSHFSKSSPMIDSSRSGAWPRQRACDAESSWRCAGRHSTWQPDARMSSDR
jgi:hypothetical protein